MLDAAPEYGMARLSVRAGAEAAEIARLQKLPWVRYAEPNYYAYAAADTYIPNDPDYYRQWHMEKVNAPMAWAATSGSLSFVVAVLDTGVAQSHPEFYEKLLPGKDYVNNPDIDGPEDDDQEGHGTHVTGIIAAGFDNGLGVAGLAPNVQILPMKVLNSQRTGSYGAIALAMYEAANSNAQVINLSLAGYAPSETLRIAAADMVSRVSSLVALEGTVQESGQLRAALSTRTVPGAFWRLAVSASDHLDRGTIYSGYKPYIGLAAPGGISGERVWSTTRAGYGYMYGTSMSAPMVSAAATLVWTLRPAATTEEVAAILKATADKVGTDPYSGEPYSYASGRNDYFDSCRLKSVGRTPCVSARVATDPASMFSWRTDDVQSRVSPSPIQHPGVVVQAHVLGASGFMAPA